MFLKFQNIPPKKYGGVFRAFMQGCKYAYEK